MTPKQIERLQKKIAQIKSTLAAEKRRFGCYDDSRGLRYLPLKYFIQLQDYKGALTYLKWFSKNFPDDGFFPDFLFEWTIILFKSGKIKEAEKTAFQTFCSNTYLFDKFLGRPVIPIDKWEGSNLQIPDFTDNFEYSAEQPELSDFSHWLQSFLSSEVFKKNSKKYIDIQKQLKTENNRERRVDLINQASLLEEGIL